MQVPLIVKPVKTSLHGMQFQIYQHWNKGYINFTAEIYVFLRQHGTGSSVNSAICEDISKLFLRFYNGVL